MISRVRPRRPAPALRITRHGCLAALMVGVVAVLYLWDPGISGWGNDYYAAAVQSGTRNTTAFLFGSLDPENVVSVDKPPLALWLMGLSVRVFGFRPWAVMLPEALAGVVAVGLLIATVRRVAGSVAGLVAGAALALTPSVVLVSRYDNPDALLLVLLVAAAYGTVRAIGDDRVRWAVGTGVLLGLAFLTKSLQAFLVAPGLLAAYAHAGPGIPGARARRIGLTAVATAAVAACWLLLVAVWPADRRPYVGGSTDNSALQQALGFNGVGRLVGSAGRSDTGPGRLFGQAVGTQIAWLLPAALVLLVAGLYWTRSAGRSDPVRASLLLWGGWLLVGGAVLSGMKGIFHSYYTSELGPAVAASVGIGCHLMWTRRHTRAARWTAAATLIGTAVWAFVLLDRTPAFVPWLRWGILAGGLVGALLVLPTRSEQSRPRLIVAFALVAALVAFGGPVAYSVATATRPHSGSGPKAGPATSTMRPTEPSPDLVAALSNSRTTWTAAVVGGRTAAALELAGVGPVMAVGGYSGADPVPTLARFQQEVAAGRIHWFVGNGGRRGVGRWIARWVADRFPARRIGDVVVYDLTRR